MLSVVDSQFMFFILINLMLDHRLTRHKFCLSDAYLRLLTFMFTALIIMNQNTNTND